MYGKLEENSSMIRDGVHAMMWFLKQEEPSSISGTTPRGYLRFDFINNCKGRVAVSCWIREGCEAPVREDLHGAVLCRLM